MRKVKGVFLENLELNDFPVDVQVEERVWSCGHVRVSLVSFKDLTITISTTRTVNEVCLVPDTHQLSAINTRKRPVVAFVGRSSARCRFDRCRRVHRSAGMASSRARRNVDQTLVKSIHAVTKSASSLLSDLYARHALVEVSSSFVSRSCRSSAGLLLLECLFSHRE
jgi:hypothetical protein